MFSFFFPSKRLAVRVEETSDNTVNTDPEDETLSTVDVKDVHDYTAIFRPRQRALNRTPPPSEEAPPPLPPPQPPATPAPAAAAVAGSRSRLPQPAAPRSAPDLPSVSRSAAAAEYRQPPPSGRAPDAAAAAAVAARRLPTGYAGVPPVRAPLASRQVVYHSTPDVRPDSVPVPTEPYRPPAGIRHSPSDPVILREPEVSTVGPAPTCTRPPYGSYTATGAVPAGRHQPAPPPPPPAPPDPADMEPKRMVPISSDKPAGLDIEDFLPSKLGRLGFGGGVPPQSAVSEAEAFSSIVKGHDSMMSVLTNRHRQLEITHSLWCGKDAKTALEHVVSRNDLATVVDLLSQLNLRPSIWNLDICQVLLPTIQELLQSKYEMYMTIGCSALKLMLKNFAHMIKTNIESPVYTHGVDISREERYNKCKGCNDQLLSIRAFLLKRQTLQGKIGQTFRELHILMQALD